MKYFVLKFPPFVLLSVSEIEVFVFLLTNHRLRGLVQYYTVSS